MRDVGIYEKPLVSRKHKIIACWILWNKVLTVKAHFEGSRLHNFFFDHSIFWQEKKKKRIKVEIL